MPSEGAYAGKQLTGQNVAMARFSTRHGHRRPLPPRVLLEQVSADVRLTLEDVLIGDGGWTGAYRKVCRYRGERPDEGSWSHDFAREPAQRLLRNLEWYEVLDLLEENGANHVDEINAAFERSGLAYVCARQKTQVCYLHIRIAP